MLWLILHHLLRAQPDSATEATMTDTVVEMVTREDLLTKLHNLNAAAMKISRRGYVGLRSAEYKRRHDDINSVLDELAGH